MEELRKMQTELQSEKQKHWRDYTPPEPHPFSHCPITERHCIAGMCAWWDTFNRRCSIATLKFAMLTLAKVLKKT